MVGVGLVVLILIVVGLLMAFVVVAVRAEDEGPRPAMEERPQNRYAWSSPSAATTSPIGGIRSLPANRVLADRLAQLDDALAMGLIDEDQYGARRSEMLGEADPTEVIPSIVPDDIPPASAGGLVFGGRTFFLILAATLAVTALLVSLLLVVGPSIQHILDSARP